MSEEHIASKSTAGRSLTVYRRPGDRGPCHTRFPAINVSATAEAYGISKSQLARLLNGQNQPSMRSLQLLAGILGKTVEEVVEIYEAMRAERAGAAAGKHKAKLKPKHNLKSKQKRK